MAVTALIPIVLFPWLGVMHSRDICVNYLKVNQEQIIKIIKNIVYGNLG